MMLRSSSTPILGSLLSSYSESPNHQNYHSSDFNSPRHQLPRKLSLNQTGPLNLFTSSPSAYGFHSSPSIHADFTDEKLTKTGAFRRVQSDGNLDGLLLSDSFNNSEEFNQQHSVTNKFSRKPHCSVLESIPSFSEHGTRRYEEEDEEVEEELEEVDEVEESGEMVQCEHAASEMRGEQVKNKEQVLYGNGVGRGKEYVESKMHLAMGLGIMTGGFNGGGGGGGEKATETGGDAGDGANVEEYYRRMMEENPGNPLFLSNYAQFLHQSKDLAKAEEYYSRAILIDPGDGEILSRYAQLTWELHRDQERASSYFERAIQAAPQDSHVLAAYAGFLWETDEDENDGDMICTDHATRHGATLATAGT